MRCLLGLLIVLSTASYGQSGDSKIAPPTAGLQGVINNLRGEPVRRATVLLTHYQEDTATQKQASNYAVESDNAGKFVFEGIAPGQYTLSATRAGYLDRLYGSTKADSQAAELLELEAGKPARTLQVVMTPQGLIGGKVTDEFGESVGPVSMQVFRRSFVRGQWTLTRSGSAQAAADSSFVIGGLAPGKYFLAAAPAPLLSSPDDKPGSHERASRARTTFYGNSSDASLAIPISLAAGMELRGHNIVMSSSPGFEVSGRVEGFPVGPLNVLLLPADEFRRALGAESYRQVLSPDQTFVLRGVAPGRYTVFVTPVNTRLNTPSGRVPVEVLDRDIDGIVITPTAQTKVTGTLVLTGAAPLQHTPEIYLGSEGGGGFGLQVNPNGVLTSPTIPVQNYQLQLYFGVAQNYYVKDVRLNGQPLINNALAIPDIPVSTLRIEISDRAAFVSGSAKNASGEAARVSQVAVWPAGVLQRESFRTLRLPEQYTGRTGEFGIGNLPPGEYHIAAFEDPAPGLLESAEFLAQFDSQAENFTVQEGGRANVSLTVITAEAIDAAESRLP